MPYPQSKGKTKLRRTLTMMREHRAKVSHRKPRKLGYLHYKGRTFQPEPQRIRIKRATAAKKRLFG